MEIFAKITPTFGSPFILNFSPMCNTQSAVTMAILFIQQLSVASVEVWVGNASLLVEK